MGANLSQNSVSPFLRVGKYCGAPVSISWKPQPTVHTGLAVKTSFLIPHHHPVTSFQNGFLRNMNYAEDCKRKCARQAFFSKSQHFSMGLSGEKTVSELYRLLTLKVLLKLNKSLGIMAYDYNLSASETAHAT